ncbi:MAG: 16S rRNA (adenine(1518)-N(6)/adenine(1519)-N(6))-dimethyltransferase RsmA [Pseudomonadota bacterium]
MDLSALPPLSAVIQAHGLDARKALGQHFLLDPSITRRIAAAAGLLAGHEVIEIGPGPGGLTRALLEQPLRRLQAVETDPRCLLALRELAAVSEGRLVLTAGDALSLPTWRLGEAPRKLVANLPYNVGTPLLIGWLQALVREPGCLESLTLMFQREVAERLWAEPRSSAYGRLSVLAQAVCRVEPCFDLPPGAFRPPPKVVSSVVQLTPLANLPSPDLLAQLERVTGAAFGQRRKMLRQSLKGLGGDPRPLLQAVGIDETARAETLSVGDFLRLAAASAAA